MLRNMIQTHSEMLATTGAERWALCWMSRVILCDQIEISHNPSGGVLLQEANSDRWFMMYTFEQPNPGVLYRLRVRLENDTDLASRLTFPVSFGRLGGLWKPRASSLTPDSVMIGTEGTPPDGDTDIDGLCLMMLS